jgi:hypothetical protein
MKIAEDIHEKAQDGTKTPLDLGITNASVIGNRAPSIVASTTKQGVIARRPALGPTKQSRWIATARVASLAMTRGDGSSTNSLSVRSQ